MEWSYPGAELVLRPMLGVGLRWTIAGSEHIPASGPVILAANHISYMDPLALGYVASRRHRRARFLAKAELFNTPVLGTLLRNGRQIPVLRNTPDAAHALAGGLDALANGECVAIFPEGTLSDDGNPMAGHTGVARLAAFSGVPVVPVGLWGTHCAWPQHRRVPSVGRSPVVAIVGSPLTVSEVEDVHDATDRIMAAICACVATARTRMGGPQSAWWYREPAEAVLRTCKDLPS